MSNPTMVLVQTADPIAKVAVSFAAFLGQTLTKSDEPGSNSYFVNCVGLEIALFEQRNFENDQGIEFEKYQFVIAADSLRMGLPFDMQDDWRQRFCLVVAQFLSVDLQCECIVVENYAELLGTFP